MILTIKLDLEKSNEAYAEVLELLTEHDYPLVSMAWEDPAPTRTPLSGQSGEGLSKNLSAAIDHVRGA